MMKRTIGILLLGAMSIFPSMGAPQALHNDTKTGVVVEPTVKFTLGQLYLNGTLIENQLGGLPGQTGNSGKLLTTNGSAASWASLSTLGIQPLDATLTALGGVTTSANTLIYATGADAFATTTLSAFARTFLDDADAATVRSTILAATGTSSGQLVWGADGIDPMIFGKTAVTNGPIFTSRNDGSSTYVRNTSNMATVYGCDLTGISVYNNGGTTDQTATLISPRHVLLANHFYPAHGSTIRFVTAGNVVVNRTLSNSAQIGSTDIRIGVLDSDVPGTIAYYKVLPSDFANTQTGRGVLYPIHASFVLAIQEMAAGTTGNMSVAEPLYANRDAFYSVAVSGDSSHPWFFVLDGQLILLGSFYSSTTAPSIAYNHAAINAAMTSLGGGYQLTDYTSSLLQPPLVLSKVIGTPNLASNNLWDSSYTNSFDGTVTFSADVQFSNFDHAILSTDGTGFVTGTVLSGAQSLRSDGGAGFEAFVALDQANNLSDLASAATARTNLGLVIGTNVQAYDSGLGLVKPAVAVVATSNLTLSGEQTIDGVLTSGSLVLLTAQSTGSQNGPWISAAGAWARPTWYTNGSTTQAPQFLTTFVRLGTTYQGSTWRMTTAAVTIGTTATTWVQTPMVFNSSSVNAFTSATLRGILSDENGTGAALFDGATSPTFVTPALGTPSALVGTNITGTAAAFNINGTVGATTPAAGTFTSLISPTLTGTASNMTITSGTGNSRTMALRTTTSGGTATTALTLNADQSATFAQGISTVGGAATFPITAYKGSGNTVGGSIPTSGAGMPVIASVGRFNVINSNRTFYFDIATTPISYAEFSTYKYDDASTFPMVFQANGGGISLGQLVDPGTGVFNANVGFRVTNAATSGNYLRGNGTNFVSAALSSGDLVGTTAVGNATAGNVGEYVESLVASGSPVSLTTATAANVTSISLTAGDWDVFGNISISGSTATYTQGVGGITTTSATIPTDGSEVYSGAQFTLLSVTDGVTIPLKRVNVSSTTTVYLVTKATFSAGTMGAFGKLSARRVR